MKKITLIAMTLLCSIAFTNCAAKKKVKQAEPTPAPVQQVNSQQAYLDSLKMAAQIAQAEADLAAAKLQARNAQYAIEMKLGQKIAIPCVELSYDKTGEYMAGLGIAENQVDRGKGLTTANKRAIAEITARYIGVIKNGVSEYSKDVVTRTKQKVEEGELEGEALAFGEKAIEKYAEVVCRDQELAADGSYTMYVAVHVPIAKVLNEVVNNMDVLQVDADRARFRAFMEEELAKQAKAKEAEKEALLKYKAEHGQ